MKKILMLFFIKNNTYLHDISISPQITLFNFLYLSSSLNFNLQNTTNLYTYLSYINIQASIGINTPINFLLLNKLHVFYTYNIKQLYKKKDDFLPETNILDFEEKYSLSAVLASTSVKNSYHLDIGIKYCNFKNSSSLQNNWGFFFKFNKKYLSLNIKTNLTDIEKIHTAYHETSHLISIFNNPNITATKISITDSIKINDKGQKQMFSGLILYKVNHISKYNTTETIKIAIAGKSIEELFKLYTNEISMHTSYDLKIIEYALEQQNKEIIPEYIETINYHNKEFIKLLMNNKITKEMIENFVKILYEKKTIGKQDLLEFKNQYYSNLFKIIFDENNKLINNSQTKEILLNISINEDLNFSLYL